MEQVGDMATVIFDFDSTLITCESLEEVLKSKQLDQETFNRVKEITAQGMSGEISFLESLQKRLSMAPLSKADFLKFDEMADSHLTAGIRELIDELKLQKIEVWIVSGALKDLVIPVGRRLGIADNHMLGIELKWDRQGNYTGLDTAKPINRSKWEGAQQASLQWSRPRIAVGDGMTDYALFEHGLVDGFVAFTKNVRRKALLEKDVPEARTVAELRQKIKEQID